MARQGGTIWMRMCCSQINEIGREKDSGACRGRRAREAPGHGQGRHREAGQRWAACRARWRKSGPTGTARLPQGPDERRPAALNQSGAAGRAWGLLAQDPGNIKCGATPSERPQTEKGLPRVCGKNHPQRPIHRGLPPTRVRLGTPGTPSISGA